jgi:uncharacterized membrane protein SpoIIM required for sporulation
MITNFWKSLSSRGKRIVSILAVFLLAVIITIAGLSVPISQDEKDRINEQLEQTRKTIEDTEGIQAVSIIFGNNFMICLIMFIPFFGPFFGSIVLFNTGTAIAAQSSVLGASPLTVFSYLFFFPFTWLEFLAYSIAFTQSFWLFWRLIQRKGKREIVNTCILISICAMALLVAAIIEVALILVLSPASV